MEILRKKNKLTATIIITILVTSAFILLTNVSVQAQTGDEVPISGPLPAGATPSVYIDTTAHLSFRPNPVGLNQIFLVNIWTSPATHRARYHPDYTVTITKPSGQEQVVTIDSYNADATAWFEWIADEVGDWTIRFDFLGTYFPGGEVPGGFMEPAMVALDSAYYRPSTSGDWTLTVQEDIVYSWPEPGITDDYWTRPVQVEHRDWWPHTGNWPGTGYVGWADQYWDEIYPGCNPHWSSNHKFTPWVDAPDSAHIVWKRQEAIAGIIGGQAKQYGLSAGGGLGTGAIPTPSIIYAGRVYDTYTKAGTGGEQYWRCYDIRTGEVYWEYQTPLVGVAGWFGSISYQPLSPDTIEYAAPTTSEVAGAEAAGTWDVNLIKITGGRLYKFNPWSGVMTVNVSISPLTSGTYYQNSYARDTDPYVLSIQNIGNTTNPEYRLINWTTRGSTSTFASRVISNTSYALSSLPSYVDWNVGLGANVGIITEVGVWTGQTITGFNAYTGQQLWYKEIPGEPTYTPMASIADHGKIAILSGTGRYIAYDLATGNLAWYGEQMDYPWSSSAFGAYSAMSAYGLLMREAMDGIYAYDWDDGSLAWKYEAPAKAVYESPYTARNEETVMPFYSFGVGGIIADGKFFTWNYEHTESWPLTRGWELHAIDCFTGEAVWQISGSTFTPRAIADGYLISSNDFTGYIYCFGKGKSETTVTASPKTVAKGAKVLIEGTVLDMSPAQPGTPCVSADSMDTQMEYLHMQMPIGGLWGDEVITGVPVTLVAIDPTGGCIDIGTTTTDGYYGTFGLTWTPTMEGVYEIIASFEGDVSYGSSAASTYVSVGPAAAAAQPIEPEPETPTIPEQPTPEEPETPEQPTPEEPETPEQPEPETAETALVSTELAIIIAVLAACAIGIISFFILRRRK